MPIQDKAYSAVDETAEHEQRQFLEGLLEVIVTIHSTLELDRVLKQILITLEEIIPYDGAGFMLITPHNTGRMAEIRGFDPEYQQQLWQMTWYLDRYPIYQEIITSRKPLIFEVKAEHWKDLEPNLNIKSYIGVPIIVDDQVTAIVHLNKYESHFYNDSHATRLQAFALQAAIAIRNAQLYQKAQQVAVLEERQRLARDLHDSVNQSLYASAMMAEGLTRMWNKAPEKVLPILEQIRTLNKSAVAEMRGLLWELQPEALERATLEECFTQLTNTINGRKKMLVSLDIQGIQAEVFPAPIRIALYRIAQEALNNIIKHSDARQVSISLSSSFETVELNISDDGKGFDAKRTTSGMGLGNMQERAKGVGAALTIISSEGNGTQIVVRWRKNPNEVQEEIHQ